MVVMIVHMLYIAQRERLVCHSCSFVELSMLIDHVEIHHLNAPFIWCAIK